MSTGWVAAQVRSRSLASHCVGPAGAREVASAGSLDGALAVLAASGYGERIHLGLNLAASERALFATVLRNLRVLAGWCPPLGASRLHVLAGGFELANLSGELARVEGRDAAEPYDLGSLASVTRSNAVAGMGGLREALRRSPWGDPGSLDGGAMRIALQFAFVRRVVESVPEAAEWAESYAALVLARELRHKGLWIELGDGGFRLKKSFEAAEKTARRIVILGEDELQSGILTVKTFSTGLQTKVPRAELDVFLSTPLSE